MNGDEELTREKIGQTEASTPESRRRLLELLDNFWSGLQRTGTVYSPANYAAVAESSEGFSELIRYGLERKPEAIFDILKAAPHLLPDAMVREHIEHLLATNVPAVCEHFDQVASYYSDAGQKELVARILQHDRSGEATILILSNPNASRHLPKEEVKSRVLKITHEAQRTNLSTAQLEQYKQQDILTAEEVRDLSLSAISRGKIDWPDKIADYAKFFPEEQRGTLRQHIIDSALRWKTMLDVKGLIDSEILSEEDVKYIFRQRIEKRPKELYSKANLIFDYLSREEIRALLLARLNNPDVDLLRSYSLQNFIASDLLLPNEREQLLNNLALYHPDEFMQNFYGVRKVVTDPTQQKKLIEAMLQRISPNWAIGGAVAMARDWVEVYSQDPKEQKAVLARYLERGAPLYFVGDYLNSSTGHLRRLFSEQEIQNFLHIGFNLEPAQLFENLSDIYAFLKDDQEFRRLLDLAVASAPRSFISHSKEVAKFYQPNEFQQAIEAVATNPGGTAECLRKMEQWAPLTGLDFAWEFIKNHKVGFASELLSYIDMIWAFIPREERKNLIDSLIRNNTSKAILEIKKLNALYSGLTEAELVRRGKTDEEILALAPKQTAEFYRSLSKTKSTSEREIILTEGTDLYTMMSSISQEGLSEDYLRLLESLRLSLKQEARLLATFYCLSLLRQRSPEIAVEIKDLQNLDAAERLAFTELAKRMGLPGDVDSEQTERFFATMESPIPFLIYYIQYEMSPQHKQILSEMFEHIINGSYEDWKYGPPTPEGLEQLKAKKLLPENLTFEQYQQWRQDDETTLYESLSSDASGVAKAVQAELIDNWQHLRNLGLGEEQDPEIALSQIQQQLSDNGQKLAETNRAIGELRRANKTDDPTMEQLGRQRTQLEKTKAQLTAQRSIFRLLTLNQQEIASGRLSARSDKSKVGEKIVQVLQNVRSQVGQEAGFVFDNIERLLTSFHEQTETKQNLLCRDSSSPKDLFEVGAKPVGSCQHYAHGSHNDCLLGYAGPDTKITLLMTDKGKVARSITRILSDQEGNPQIHEERIYSASASSAVARSIHTHITQKGQEISVNTYASTKTRVGEGGLEDIEVIPGFEFLPTQVALISRGSIAPKVYVDSSDGDRPFGEYTIEDLVEIRKS